MSEETPRPVAAYVYSVALRLNEFAKNKTQMRVIYRTLAFKLWACLAGQFFDVDGRANARERLRMRRLRRCDLNQGDV
jgi:hypothetical protein